jgi:histidine triad (HIT) family protein
MSSIFTKIIQKEFSCYKISETENCFAFLDASPIAKGHVLVIPKQEVDYIFNLEDNLLSELNIFAKKIAKAIDKTMSCTRVGVAVIGLEVPHAHIHLVPINNVSDIDFSRPKLSLDDSEMESIAIKIRAAL